MGLFWKSIQYHPNHCFSFVGGNSIIKSRVIDDQGLVGVSMSFNKPGGFTPPPTCSLDMWGWWLHNLPPPLSLAIRIVCSTNPKSLQSQDVLIAFCHDNLVPPLALIEAHRSCHSCTISYPLSPANSLVWISLLMASLIFFFYSVWILVGGGGQRSGFGLAPCGHPYSYLFWGKHGVHYLVSLALLLR